MAIKLSLGAATVFAPRTVLPISLMVTQLMVTRSINGKPVNAVEHEAKPTAKRFGLGGWGFDFAHVMPLDAANG
jgi:hypothetical protein